MQIIKRLTYSFEDKCNVSDALYEVSENFYKLQQGEHESLQDYHEHYKSHVIMMDEVGTNIDGDTLWSTVAAEHGQANANDDDHEEAKQSAIAI